MQKQNVFFQTSIKLASRLYDAKTLHYSAKIEECGHDPKAP